MSNIGKHILQKKTIDTNTRALLVAILLITGTLSAKAQLNPFQSMYYQNKYLYNPAMAGMDPELNLNIAYRQQWSSFPGTPKTGSFTADFQPADRVGLGININDDQAGLIRQTRIMGTYAYHVPLSDHNQHLNFGLSLGIDDSHVNYNNVNGDVTDIEIAQYNQLKPYVDGDFGIAYSSDNLNIGAAIPNLKSVFSKSSDARFDADRLLFITVASYKFPLKGDDQTFSIEPLAALRIVKGYSDIFDAGFNFNFDSYGLYFQGVYHSSQSIGLGVGFDEHTYAFNFSYDLETGQLNNYTQGTFELGIKLRLFGKK